MTPLPRAWPPAAAAERVTLQQAARERATELRREAISEFWRATDAWIVASADRAQRAARRLAARLRHHARRRGMRV